MNRNFTNRTNCPACNDSNFNEILKKSYLDDSVYNFINTYYEGRVQKDILKDTDFIVSKCKNCGCLFQKNILNNELMFELYENWISKEQSLAKKVDADISLYSSYAEEIKNISKLLNKKPSEIKILEYGTGWGFWLNMARGFGYDVSGIEYSSSRIEYAKKSGLNIINSLADIENNRYDYIFSDQVFEHLPNPFETLSELKRVVKNDGIIHIKVPDAQFLENKLKEKNWYAQKDEIHPLEHINSFTKNSLEAMATKVDLRILQSTNKFGDGPFFLSNFYKSIQNFGTPYEVVQLNKNKVTIDDIVVVIRSCGERTVDICKKIILDIGFNETQIFIVNEIPFLREYLLNSKTLD